MSDSESDDTEIVFIVRSTDQTIAADLVSAFPDASVSEADNFIGGVEVAAFLDFASDVLGKILDFLGKNRARISSAKLTIAREKIDITGYSAADAEKLLATPAVKAALKAMKKPR